VADSASARLPDVPTYEYECTSCGQHIEVFQRFTEDALTTCGACGGALRKVFHPAGIVFKGSGFYTTDSRSGTTSDSSRKDSKPDSKKEASKETKPGTGASPGSSDSGSKGSTSKEPSAP
jgi:putative FmdB family regulatory protein